MFFICSAVFFILVVINILKGYIRVFEPCNYLFNIEILNFFDFQSTM
jgi:hypothetical protein